MKNKNKIKGYTLIEFLIVVILSMVFISSLLILYKNFNDLKTRNEVSKDYALILESVMKRVVHDSAEWNLWELTASDGEDVQGLGYSPVPATRVINPINDYILWNDTEAVVKSLMRNFLVGKDHPANNCGAWNAKPDPFSGNTESLKTAYIPCGMWQNGNDVLIPFNIKMKAAAIGDPVNADISTFLLYLDLKDSEIVKGYGGQKGFNAFMNFYNEIKSNLKKEPIGTQYLKLVLDSVNLNDANDDIFADTSKDCMDALSPSSPNNCLIRLEVNFVDFSTSEYLLVGGNNDMRAAISFRQASSSLPQQCLRWIKDSSDTWTSTLVDCGIWGGNDSVTVDGVLENVNTTSLNITLRDGSGASLDHQCPIYVKSLDEENGFFTLADKTTPCGLSSDNSVVQLTSDYAYVGKIYAEDIMVQDFRANRIQVMYDPVNYNNPKLVQIKDENDKVVFEVNKNGYIQFGTGDLNGDGVNDLNADVKVFGSLDVNNGLSAEGNSIFYLNKSGDLVTIDVNSTGGSNLGNIRLGDVVSDLTIVDSGKDTLHNFGSTTNNKTFLGMTVNNSLSGFAIESNNDLMLKSGDDITLRANDNINLQSNNINLEGDVLLTGNNKAYANTSSFRDKTIESLNGTKNFYNLGANEKSSFEYVTKDYIKHIMNIVGNFSIRNVVLVNGAGSNLISRPDCLDFTKNGTDLSNPYYGTANYQKDGYDLSRILLINIWQKTFSAGFGDNQAYTHHAIATVANMWEVYQYASGSGASGTGAREDGAGASLGLIYCDYSGVSW